MRLTTRAPRWRALGPAAAPSPGGPFGSSGSACKTNRAFFTKQIAPLPPSEVRLHGRSSMHTKRPYTTPLRSCAIWVRPPRTLAAGLRSIGGSRAPVMDGGGRVLPRSRARAVSFAGSCGEVLDIASASSADAVGGDVPAPCVGMTLRAVPPFRGAGEGAHDATGSRVMVAWWRAPPPGVRSTVRLSQLCPMPQPWAFDSGPNLPECLRPLELGGAALAAASIHPCRINCLECRRTQFCSVARHQSRRPQATRRRRR